MSHTGTHCDFIPDECTALLIQACILAKKCRVAQFELAKYEKRLGKAATLIGELRIKLDAHAECLIENIRAAFARAGCPIPPFPQPPQPPDIGNCVNQAVNGLKQDITDPLAFLNGLVNIEFDSNFKPLRISTPL